MLPKHPGAFSGGDTRVSLLVTQVARELASVESVALVPPGISPNRHLDIESLRKTDVNLGTLAVRALLRRRSLIHARFDTSDLRSYLRQVEFDKYVAEHAYMAESLLVERPSEESLFVNAHVLESDVLRRRGGPVFRAEATRVFRDECRVYRAAAGVAFLDPDETKESRQRGEAATHLPIFLPPSSRATPELQGKTMIFIGDRTWPPNDEAARRLVDIWRAVRRREPMAELLVVGRRGRSGELASDGIHDLGFVDDLDSVLLRSRALIAPVVTGGGVRVKILEAASIGLPVVATPAAAGGLTGSLGITSADSNNDLVEASLRYLGDRAYTKSASEEIWERNMSLWNQGVVHEGVGQWLKI
jgi:glycosyltransferase involved in cell wall biosynthesis